MSHVSDFTQEQNKIVLDLINFDNGTNLNLSQVEIGDVGSGDVAEVTASVEAKVGSGYSGNQSVTYNRLNIQDFADVFYPGGLVVPEGSATSLHDVLTEINAALGIALTTDDVVNQPFNWVGSPNEFLDITLAVIPGHKVYFGDMLVTIDNNEISLASIVTVRVLSGLNLPVTDGGGGDGGKEPPAIENPIPHDPSVVMGSGEWTHYTINPAHQTESGKLTFFGAMNGQVRYRLNTGSINTIPSGQSDLIIPPGVTDVYFSVAWGNVLNTENNIVTPVHFNAITEFQTTGQPLTEFKKTHRFTSVPAAIPSNMNSLAKMFWGATTFNQDISGWNTSNITNMEYFASEASSFNQDLSGWNVGGVGQFSATGFDNGAIAWVLPKPNFS